jgi:uncharacterized protein
MFDDTYDREKSAWTKQERGIDFVEAREVFSDPDAVEVPARRVNNEDRFLTVGMVKARLWAVGWTMRPNGVRIFSVRPPRDDEKEQYEAAK